MALSYQYNKQSKKDILRHAKALEKCQIGDVYDLEQKGKKRPELLDFYEERKIQGWTDEDGKRHKGDKGRIGFMVQEIYFDEPRDNDSESDLRAAGVELKVSPLVEKKRVGLKVKERLVLGKIERIKSEKEKLPQNFFDSHIYKKCKLMMLVYYKDESQNGKTPFHFRFHKSEYVEIESLDMAMIERDYQYIRDCVNNKRYDDLHEKNAHYLSPCRKGNGRAYSLKLSYMNEIFSKYIDKGIPLYKPIIKNPEELRRASLEEIVIELFSRHKNKTIKEIRRSIMKPKEFKKWESKTKIDKAEFARTTMAMLGVDTDQAEEFVKSNICVKTLRVEKNLKMNEDISFSAFEFSDLSRETWKKSFAYEEMVNRKFLWSVFVHDGDDYKFRGATFWSLPEEDEPVIKRGWEDIRNIVRKGVKFAIDVKTIKGKPRVLNSFPDSNNTNQDRKEYKLCKSTKPRNKIISIRPHAQHAYYDLKTIGYKDTEYSPSNGSILPNGDVMTKQCFWFNNEYILEQIKKQVEL